MAIPTQVGRSGGINVKPPVVVAASGETELTGEEVPSAWLDPSDLIPDPAKNAEAVVQFVKRGDQPTQLEWAAAWLAVGGYYLLIMVLLMGSAAAAMLAVLKWRKVI